MPSIYLSPSTQERNLFVTGGTEEQYMNLIADAMEPYLRASGISFTRNTPQMTAASSIRASNAGNYDLHLAIHSNAAPEARAGQVRGADFYYAPNSSRGRKFANIAVANYKTIYPIPSLVRALSTTRLGEVTQTRAPAVLVETAYHDNIDDANWIRNNINNIAANLAFSVAEFLNVPFKTPERIRRGQVSLSSGRLNVRAKPTTSAAVIGQLNNGQIVTVYGSYLGWYIIDFGGRRAYVKADYVRII